MVRLSVSLTEFILPATLVSSHVSSAPRSWWASCCHPPCVHLVRQSCVVTEVTISGCFPGMLDDRVVSFKVRMSTVYD